MILRATLDTLANMLRCRGDQAEDVVRSERSARASFNRRGLFQAAGAVAAGTLFADELYAGYTFDIRAVNGWIGYTGAAAQSAAERFFVEMARRVLVEKVLFGSAAGRCEEVVALWEERLIDKPTALSLLNYAPSEPSGPDDSLLLHPSNRLESSRDECPDPSEHRDDLARG